jgi:hypothetical protein
MPQGFIAKVPRRGLLGGSAWEEGSLYAPVTTGDAIDVTTI